MTKEICVINRKGFHARPATVFVEVASKYTGEITVTYGNRKVNGKSLIALMSLSVPHNGVVTINVEGNDVEKTMKELEDILGINYE